MLPLDIIAREKKRLSPILQPIHLRWAIGALFASGNCLKQVGGQYSSAERRSESARYMKGVKGARVASEIRSAHAACNNKDPLGTGECRDDYPVLEYAHSAMVNPLL